MASLQEFKNNTNLSDGMYSIFEKFATGFTDYQFKQESKSIGNEFDFMNGKDVENEEDYNNAINALAQAEIDEKDTDKDGAISYDEYVQAEIASAGTELSEEDIAQVEQMSKILFDAINDTDDESDTTLDINDMTKFYETLDKYNATGEYNGLYQEVTYDGVADGKLNVGAAEAYINDILNHNTPEEQELKNNYKTAMENGFTYDVNNKEEELGKLAQGEILTKDIDGDGVLTQEEFALYAVNSLGENATEEEKAKAQSDAIILSTILDQGTEKSDANREISAQELAQYYSSFDKFQNGAIQEQGDGIINFNESGTFLEYLKELFGISA